MKRLTANLMALLMLIVCILAVYPSFDVQAAEDGTITVSASAASCNVGDTIMVTVTVSLHDSCTGNIILGDYVLNYNGAVVSYNGDTSGRITAPTYDDDAARTYTQTFQFVAHAEGTVNFTISDALISFDIPVDGKDNAELSLGSASVTVSAPEPPPTEAPTEAPTAEPTEPPTEAPTESPKSSNANLASLAISPGALLERFSADRTEYTAQILANDVTVLVVGLETEDPNATYTIEGNSNLQVGENKIVITVTAEDGVTKKVYTITAQREDASTVPTDPVVDPTNPAEDPTEEQPSTEEDSTGETSESGEYIAPSGDIAVDNVFGAEDTMYLESDWDDEEMPAGFEKASVVYKDQAVWAAVSEAGLKLYYLSDISGENKQFYVYDEVSDLFYEYYSVSPNGGTYILLNGEDAVLTKGLRQVMLRLNDGGPTFNAWLLADDVNDGIFLIYAMLEDGTTGWFRFDTKYGTFVRYYADPNQSKPDDSSNNQGDEALEQAISSLEAANREQESKHNASYNDLVMRYNDAVNMRKMITVGLLLALAAVFVIALVLAIKLRSIYKEYDFIDDDEEEEEAESDDKADDSSDDGEPQVVEKAVTAKAAAAAAPAKKSEPKQQQQKLESDEAMEEIAAALNANLASEVTEKTDMATKAAETKEKSDDDFEFIEF